MSMANNPAASARVHTKVPESVLVFTVIIIGLSVVFLRIGYAMKRAQFASVAGVHCARALPFDISLIVVLFSFVAI